MRSSQVDRQLTALAGEFFVAGELLKRGLQVSVTFGNAKAIDLFARNARTGCSFTIQVKALRKWDGFPLRPDRVEREHIYVFVILNQPEQAVRYFVVSGAILLDRDRAFRGFHHATFPGIHPNDLKDFEGKWEIFEAR
jgi:hypothetical protein